jgi:hypothetical protein
MCLRRTANSHRSFVMDSAKQQSAINCLVLDFLRVSTDTLISCARWSGLRQGASLRCVCDSVTFLIQATRRYK